MMSKKKESKSLPKTSGAGQFKKTLEQIAYRHQVENVFDDWMQLMICAFSMQRMEDQYMKIISGYTAEEANLFARAMGELLMEITDMQDKDWYDPLGRYFEEINSRSTV